MTAEFIANKSFAGENFDMHQGQVAELDPANAFTQELLRIGFIRAARNTVHRAANAVAAATAPMETNALMPNAEKRTGRGRPKKTAVASATETE